MDKWYLWWNKLGDRYEGEWKDCLKHGNGTDIFANGDSYSGQYKFGKPSGYGQYIWKDGSCYSGEFQSGLKNGFGKYRKNKDVYCNMYEGQYYKDKKQGFGIFKWATGNIYRGQYKADEREGIGEMKWTDGSVYIGQWQGGIQHGYGRMIFSNGTIKEGLFDNNVYKGPDFTGQIPYELQNPAFDVMSLCPQEINFSEEITSFFPVSYSQIKLTKGLPLKTIMKNSNSRNSIKYIQYPSKETKLTRNYTNKLRISSQSQKRGQTRSTTPGKDQFSRPMTNINTIYRCSNQNLSTRKFMKSPIRNNLLYNSFIYTGNGSTRLRQKSTKKIWKPSGKIHYQDAELFSGH